jgi:hypothetical protein
MHGEEAVLSGAHEPFNPAMRGFHAVYREDETNYCPGCGRTHWLIGRTSAECAFCGTALALREATRQLESSSRPPIWTRGGKPKRKN